MKSRNAATGVDLYMLIEIDFEILTLTEIIAVKRDLQVQVCWTVKGAHKNLNFKQNYQDPCYKNILRGF